MPSLSSREGGGDAHAHAYAMLYYTKRKGGGHLAFFLFERGRRRCPCPCLCYAILCYSTLYYIISSSDSMRKRGGRPPCPLSVREGGGDAHAHAHAMLYYAKRRGRRTPCHPSQYFREGGGDAHAHAYAMLYYIILQYIISL